MLFRSLTLTIELENQSNIDTKEVVQVYFNDLFAEISRPNLELVAFKKVLLKANQKRTVKIELNYLDFMYKDDQNNLVLEPGIIKIMIGTPRKIVLEKELMII